MTAYAVNIPGKPLEFFSWPKNYLSPIRSEVAFDKFQVVQVDDSTDPIIQGFFRVYSAEKATYQKIWQRYGAKSSDNLTTVRHEFCEWIEQQEIKILDLNGISLCSIDLDFLSYAKKLEVLILRDCHLKNKHADQLETILKDRSLKKVDLSKNISLERAPRLEHVEHYVATDCAISKRLEGIEIDLDRNFLHPYGDSEPCYADSDSDSADESYS